MTALFRSVDPADGEELSRDATMTWRETDTLLNPATRAFGGGPVSPWRSAPSASPRLPRLREAEAVLAALIVAETGMASA